MSSTPFPHRSSRPVGEWSSRLQVGRMRRRISSFLQQNTVSHFTFPAARGLNHLFGPLHLASRSSTSKSAILALSPADQSIMTAQTTRAIEGRSNEHGAEGPCERSAQLRALATCLRLVNASGDHFETLSSYRTRPGTFVRASFGRSMRYSRPGSLLHVRPRSGSPVRPHRNRRTPS